MLTKMKKHKCQLHIKLSADYLCFIKSPDDFHVKPLFCTTAIPGAKLTVKNQALPPDYLTKFTASGNPAIITHFRALDLWLCDPAFQRVGLYHQRYSYFVLVWYTITSRYCQTTIKK
jgi:hypothetical protein